MCHNNLRDINADLLEEVCSDVTVEPPLQLLTGEVLSMRTSIRGEKARLDISVRGFWGGWFELSFFDVRVFNPSTPTNRSHQPTAIYHRHSRRIAEPMNSMSMKMREPPSQHWCLQQVAEWARQPLSSTIS